MEIQIAGGGATQVSDDVFGRDFNEALIHQVVTAFMAGARQGSKAQMTRSDVSGGGKKPWRQKGTGRARAGTIRSPIWRSGGVTFAARPRDFEQKVNRKMYRAAVRSILSELVRQERLIVVEKLELAEAKTKLMAAKLNELGCERGALIVTEELDANVFLASRNIPYVTAVDAAGVDPVSLVGFDKVVMTVDAVKRLEEKLA